MQSKVTTSRQQNRLSWNQRLSKPKPCPRMLDWLRTAWKDNNNDSMDNSSDGSDSPNHHDHHLKRSSPHKPMLERPLPPMKMIKTEHISSSPIDCCASSRSRGSRHDPENIAAAAATAAAACGERTKKESFSKKRSENSVHADAEPLVINIDDDDDDDNIPRFDPDLYLPEGECIEDRFLPSSKHYDLVTFEDHLEHVVERELQKSTIQLEQSNWIRKANRSMDKGDTQSQEKAQYGRILYKPFQTVLDQILCINPETDVYLDLGHGLGNTVFQAAFMSRCEARGIEVDSQRNTVALVISEGFQTLQKQSKESDLIEYVVGPVDLQLGSLSDPQFREFITLPSPGKKCIKAFCNNFNGVFGDKSSKRGQKYHLDHYIAGLFACMPPQSILVTLHPLDLGLSQSHVIEKRNRHGMRTPDPSLASFFECETVSLGSANECVSWAGTSNTSTIYLYKYTRLPQTNAPQSAFLCSNPYCQYAKEGTCIQATQFDYSSAKKGMETPRVVMNRCDCGGDRMSRRMQNRANPKVAVTTGSNSNNDGKEKQDEEEEEDEDSDCDDDDDDEDFQASDYGRRCQR